MKPDLEFYAEYSRFARRWLEADASLAEEMRASAPWTVEAMEAFIAESFAKADASHGPADLGATLRRLRVRVMLRTLARDLAGEAPLAEVCSAMTALAEVSLRHAQALAERGIEAEFGRPQDGSRLIVVGMGKLGGGELNVSSDIDLVFIYPGEGDTVGGPRSLSHHEYFSRMGKRLIALIAAPTEHGSVFRVDMRLRPWGDDGPLAASFEALENYLLVHGREWERYAWIKSRLLTGDRHAELEALVRPFVYRKYLDYGTLGAMRGLHAEVRAEVARRELADHVKLGPGGIREIEFIAQAFQLIRGGREAELRARPTLEVLALLAGKGVLSPEARRELADAYDFLRRVEHRLQYLDDAQTHTLPEDEGDRERVARAMGFGDWRAFRIVLDDHRDRVSRHFEHVFATPDSPRHALTAVWISPAGDESTARLEELGYGSSAATRLALFRSSRRYMELPDASRTRVDAMVPELIEQAAGCPRPDEALARSLDLLEAVSRRAAYLALLAEHPQALSRVVDLVSASPWAADYLVQHPIVLDELLDPRSLAEEGATDWNEFRNDLLRRLGDFRGDIERQMDLLREAHHGQVFRLLARDLAGGVTVEQLADELAELADIMLEVTLQVCWLQVRERFPDFADKKPRFAVIGYGKLGGKELGYASDLDIIFLYEDPTDAAGEAYARLGQRLNNWLTARTAAGVLFETDLRLRPEGESGLMVSSIEAFRRYQRESAWTWEHQALTRARFCAGDAGVGAAFEEERRAILQQPRDPGKLRAEVLDMRRQLLAGHPNRSELFDIKHDRGGMIDVEFLVQYLVLAHAASHPELTANDGNIALLGLAAGLGLIEQTEAAPVQEAYRRFRRRQHALRMAGERFARVPADELEPEIAATRRLWRSVFGED